MRLKYISIIILLYTCLSFVKGQNSLHGKITEAITGQILPGVIVFIPQLKTGILSDSTGEYKFSDIPKGSYTVEARFLSYATERKQVTINGIINLNFSLKDSSTITREVVITAMGIETNIQRTAEPVTMVRHSLLVQGSSTNLVDAISTQPGISAITTGPGISKPEINGLGYNRVLTLLDGVRQEDFQWGDEHGILIDPYAVYDAEIIRGPASLQYGANAVAGVVSFKSQPAMEQGKSTIKGSVNSEYQSNNGLFGNSLNIGGNNKGFVWDVRASNEQAHCYYDPKDGYVWGTAFYQSNARAVLALYKNWGYTRLTISVLHKQIEIPDGNRDSLTRQFEFDTPQPFKGKGNPQYYSTGSLIGQLIPGTGKVYPDNSNFLSYNPDISSYQVLNHDLISWQNSINVGNGKILADIGYTMSHRQEIDTGVVAEENMTVNDIPYSIKYQLENEKSGIKFTSGLNGMYEAMHNGSEPPSPYIGDFEIPDYNIFDIGGYFILQKEYKKLTLCGGLRYDFRIMNGQPMYLNNYDTPQQQEVSAGTPGAWIQFLSFNRTFTGFSGSIGATYQLPENNYIKLNLAKSFRAPAINELTSNEVNPGGNLYESGDRNLKPEEGYQVDLTFGNNGKDINFEVDGFCNYIENFIFSNRLTNSHGGDTTALGKSIFKYKANTAIITGVAARLNIHPALLNWLELDNGFTYIYNFLPGQTDSTCHIPWTAAPRLTSELKVKLKVMTAGPIRNTYIKFGLAKYWAQKNIFSAYYTELPSYAYTLFNAGIGTNIVNRKTSKVICTCIINVTNLMNIVYVDHTSRTQYFWAYNGVNDPTNYGLKPSIVTKQSEGIFNIGRNIGFKIIIPITLH